MRLKEFNYWRGFFYYEVICLEIIICKVLKNTTHHKMDWISPKLHYCNIKRKNELDKIQNKMCKDCKNSDNYNKLLLLT